MTSSAADNHSASVDAVTCFISKDSNDQTVQGNLIYTPPSEDTSSRSCFQWPWKKTPQSIERAAGTDDSDDEPELKAFNPEDYEYTMFLQFVDPAVEKEYLKNAKIKVFSCLQCELAMSLLLCIPCHAGLRLLCTTHPIPYETVGLKTITRNKFNICKESRAPFVKPDQGRHIYASSSRRSNADNCKLIAGHVSGDLRGLPLFRRYQLHNADASSSWTCKFWRSKSFLYASLIKC
jgi:hypothetical protein